MATRIDGIMSGLDTESLIKGMLSYQQSQIDRLKKKNTMLTWQRELYSSVYTKIDTYRTNLYSYKLDSTTKLKSATSSHSSIVTATASADAAVGIHTMEVTKLAKGAQTGSQFVMGTVGSKESLSLQFDFAGSHSTLATPTDDIKIAINGKIIEVDASGSMNDFVKAINNSGAGVSASYDSNLDRFFISTTETGEAAKIDFYKNPDGTAAFTPGDPDFDRGIYFLENILQLEMDSGLVKTHEGQDAEFILDGVSGLKQSSNDFTIAGITYSLNDTTTALGTEVTIKVANDTEGIYQSVVNFVNMYNEILEELNTVLYDQKTKGYEPLTDEEKEGLSAEQISQLEAKAKTGILRNDSILASIRNNMRTIIYSPVSGISSQIVNGQKVTYNSLFAIGLKTGDYSTNGKLEIDEIKLKAAIEADPEAVNKIINGGTDADGNRTEGVADKLYDSLKVGMDKINDKSGAAAGGREITSYMAKQIAANEKAIAKKVNRYNAMMATYYKQFDAMEKLLQQLQSQQDSLYNYLG